MQEDDSSEEEGFYKPALKVEHADQEPPPSKNIVPLQSSANDLIMHKRPDDYLPRVLTIAPHLQTLPQPPGKVETEAEQMTILKRQKLKKCKYLSLSDKYCNNALYKLVYAKIDTTDNYNSFIFSLNNTTDYNPNNYVPPSPSPTDPDSPFQSRFESGNLLYAYLATDCKSEQYDLILQNDTNTRGYNQWFYFAFTSQKKGSVRFNIVNMVKKHNLFEDGVRPVGWFKGDAMGWHPIGSNIDYQKSYVSRQLIQNSSIYRSFYTLSFTINFEQPQTVYLALNYPYTYTHLVHFLNEVENISPANLTVSREIVCYSISNNAIPCLRINHCDYQKDGKKIVLMGRQHPGETAGSFVLEACVRSLLKEERLLRNYELIILPMINVDGVIYGNFRTNLAGFDLNRQWTDPNRWLHPEIYYISKFLSGLEKISFVLDFHSHSKKFNSFIYACTGQQPSQFRLFPYICGKLCPNFSMKDCAYSITADKERTARIKLFRQINKPQVFTLQTSFFGYQDGNLKKYRFRVKDLIQIGKGITSSLVVYLSRKKQMQQYEKEVKDKQYLFDQWSVQNRQDIDSQSNPSEDELTPIERKEKVLAEVDSKKINHRSKSNKKKKFDYKKQPIPAQPSFYSKARNIETKSELKMEEVIKMSPVKPNLIRKKTQMDKLADIKKVQKRKKNEKMMSIVVSPTKTINTTMPPVPIIDPKPRPSSKFHSASESKVVQPLESSNNSSNLFNKNNYFIQLQQKLQGRDTRSNLHQKTQSLEINNLKKQISCNANTMDVLRKLIASDEDPYYETTPHSLHREKVYIIRENRIVNSIARTNEIQMKKHIEEEISNRTEALRNCQKKMRQMSLNEPIIPSESEPEFKTAGSKSLYSALKAYKFPTIKMDRRTDHFIF